MDVGTSIGGTWDGRADGVADAVDEGALFLCQLNGGQRVSSLTRLRDGNDNVVFSDYGIAIAELRGVLHLTGNAAERFKELFANESGVPRRTASHNDDALGLQELATEVDECRKSHVVALDIDTSAHAVGEALRLFENFLKHEVLVTPLFYLSEVDVDGLHLQLLFLTENTHDMYILTQSDDGDVAILEIHHLVGIFDDGAGIGTEEEFPVADTNYKRTLLASGNDLRGVTLVENGDSVGTDDLIKCHLNSLEQREVFLHHNILHELYQHLGIGVAFELDALGLEFLLYVRIILNDSIVDNGQIMALRIVRVGIASRRLSVGGPARMGDTDIATDILVAAILRQVVNLTLRLVDVQLTVSIDECHTCRVVTTILEPTKSLNQNRISVLLSYVSNYSTHIIFIVMSCFIFECKGKFFGGNSQKI